MRRGLDKALAAEMYRRGCTDGEIADAPGVGRKAVGWWRWRQGLPPHRSWSRPGNARVAGCEAEMRALHARGLNDSEVGRVVGISGSAVGAWRRRAGLECNYRGGRPGGQELALGREEEAELRRFFRWVAFVGGACRRAGAKFNAGRAIKAWRASRGGVHGATLSSMSAYRNGGLPRLRRD